MGHRNSRQVGGFLSIHNELQNIESTGKDNFIRTALKEVTNVTDCLGIFLGETVT